MSISIPGTLQVIRRTGKNGDFSVGELITDIGRFRVKHKVLDEFEQGSCKGVFVITEVFNVISTTKSGQIWGNLCADLDWDLLKVMAQTDSVDETLEATAAVEETIAEMPQPEPANEPTAAPVRSDDNLVSDLSVLAQMLEDGVSEIKLDNTLEDRAAFHVLRNAVKETGKYRFDPNGQKWVRKEQSAQSAE